MLVCSGLRKQIFCSSTSLSARNDSFVFLTKRTYRNSRKKLSQSSQSCRKHTAHLLSVTAKQTMSVKDKSDSILAALDVGSGATKLEVATVRKGLERWRTIGESKHSEQVELLLAHDFKKSKDGTLSPEIMESAMEILTRLKGEAEQKGAERIVAVATAVFRKAKNAGELIHRIQTELEIPIQVISQDMEGEVGFMTALAGLAEDTDPGNVVVWDSGGASFQLTAKAMDDSKEKYDVYQGPLGASLVTAMLIEQVQKKDFSVVRSPNPVQLSEARQLVESMTSALPPVPTWLNDKFSVDTTKVVGIGGETCAFRIASLALGQSTFTAADVWSAVESLVGSSDEELSKFPQPEMVIPKLLLLHAVMLTLNIKAAEYKFSQGGCPGVLTLPCFWES